MNPCELQIHKRFYLWEKLVKAIRKTDKIITFIILSKMFI